MDLQQAREEIRRADREMAALFERRMAAVRAVAAYKNEHGLPIEDKAQEARVIARGCEQLKDEALRPYYVRFLQDTMELSKQLQRQLISGRSPSGAGSARLTMELGERSYDIIVRRGCLQEAGSLLNLDRKVLIVTDEGVPAAYADALAAQCRAPQRCTVAQGEGSKSLPVLERLLEMMLQAGFTRSDCVCAVGGGVVGDLAGFAASSYMRGIDFYNIPTTVLSQVDSAIGGKTAVNLGGVKNIVGAFWQPKRVLIDPDTLKTLPSRQRSAGLAEALKAGLIADAQLVSLFERGETEARIDEVILAALRVKKAVVEADERESGLRKILNFGHTIGHGIESVTGLLHGECVALGMLPMCSPEIRARLLPIYETLGLPTQVRADPEAVWAALLHDKKAHEGAISVVRVNEIGSYCIEDMAPAALRPLIDLVVRP